MSPAGAETATPESITIPSRLFGPLRVTPSALIRFPDGLLGFGGDRTFALLPAGIEGAFWLQDANESGLAFLAVDPFRFVSPLVLDIPDPTGEEAEARDREQLLVLSLVTFPDAPGGDCTANLQAPLLVDLLRRHGRQVVLEQCGYTTRHPITLPRSG